MQTLRQCTKCTRFFDGDQLVSLTVFDMVSAFKNGQIQIFECGRSDCQAPSIRRCPGPHRRNQTVSRRRSHYQSVKPSSDHLRGCPPEADDAPENTRTHAQNQAAFVAEGAGDTDNEILLNLLRRGFNENDPTRSSRGQWISTADLIFVHRIQTVHSRASQLRGSDSLKMHPFIAQYRLDVDSYKVNGKWGYSLCFIENSERLKRERKEDERQPTLT